MFILLIAPALVVAVRGGTIIRPSIEILRF